MVHALNLIFHIVVAAFAWLWVPPDVLSKFSSLERLEGSILRASTVEISNAAIEAY